MNYSPPEPTPRPHRRRMHPFVIVGIVLAALLVVCGGGVGAVGLLSAGQDKAPQAAVSAQPTHTRDTSTGTPSAGLSTAAAEAPSPTKAAPPPPPPPVTVEDGTWTVGEDFPAGRYLTKGAPADCFWSIYKSGTNQSDIIDNHIGGGNLRVTLKAGQDFTSQDCGTWVKQ